MENRIKQLLASEATSSAARNYLLSVISKQYGGDFESQLSAFVSRHARSGYNLSRQLSINVVQNPDGSQTLKFGDIDVFGYPRRFELSLTELINIIECGDKRPDWFEDSWVVIEITDRVIYEYKREVQS